MKLVNLCNSSCGSTETEDANCVVLGYLDIKEGVVKPVTSSDSLSETFHSKSLLSKSLIVDNVNINSSKATAKKRPHEDSEVSPMPVYEILYNQGALGKSVIKFIKEKKFISAAYQSHMLRILAEYVVAKGGTYYPPASVKISMAMGIINDFPELADDDKGYSSWYNPTSTRGIIQTKFQSLRGKLPQQEKKNKQRTSQSRDSVSEDQLSTDISVRPSVSGSRSRSATGSNAASLSVASSSVSLMCSKKSSLELSAELQCELSTTRKMTPTSSNLVIILKALKNSFVPRRKWIIAENPSCTDILEKFHHIGSFEGRMISEEFNLMFPLANDLIECFKRWAPHIIKYAQTVKPAVLESLNDQFSDTLSKENTIAMLLLPKLLPTTANSKTMKACELDHLKLYKSLLDALVSSALVQIVPEGTNAKLYCSKESPRQEGQRKKSIFPFLLWLTNDCKGGQMYLKIDQITFYLGNSTEDLLLKGIDLIMKAYWVFNLQYHPYLKATYNFLEVLYGINTSSITSVTKFSNALRNISTSET